jgi:hypothetical protein
LSAFRRLDFRHFQPSSWIARPGAPRPFVIRMTSVGIGTENRPVSAGEPGSRTNLQLASLCEGKRGVRAVLRPEVLTAPPFGA